MVKRADKPYLVSVKRHGRVYWYFRRAGTYVRLPDDPDSPQFDAAYWEIRSGKVRPSLNTTFENLIVSYYQSPKYKNLGERTKMEYRRTLELIREKNGSMDFTALRRRNVIAARDTYADTWRKANAMVEQLSILASHAVELEWITSNPAKGIPKLKGGEYKPWPEEKQVAFVRYCERHELHTELMAFYLGIGTGQRIGDIVKMEWAHFDGEYMEVTQEKTGVRIWVYCPTRLKDHLNKARRKGRFILAKNLTEHIAKRQVQQLVQEVREKTGALDFVIHGWRYTAASELAEAGCSDVEIQAVTGHRSLGMVQKYRSQANQKKLSKRAQDRRNGTETERESVKGSVKRR